VINTLLDKGLHMKITELLAESRYDDWDKEEELPGDPDQDKVPNLIIQFKKSMDVDGRYPIVFRDGSKVNIPTGIMVDFLNKYDDLKPMDRESMQNLAAQSVDKFKEVLATFKGEKPERSIYNR
jgi:hypothetical protein